MSTFTETFKFAKPSGDDNVSVSPFNANADSIDAILTAGGGYEVNSDLGSFTAQGGIIAYESEYIQIDDYAPDLTGISTVTVQASVDGEPMYDGECEVGENSGFTMVAVPLDEHSYAAMFVPKCALDTSGESPEPTPSDTSSVLIVLYPDLFGKEITMSIEANIVTPIPAKFLTEVPKVTVTTEEQVVGTYMGETLYERTYTQPIDTSGTVDTIQIALDDSITYQFCYVDKCILGVSTDGDIFEQTITNDYFESTSFMGATYNSGNVFVVVGSDIITDTDKLYMLFVTVRYIKGEAPTPPTPPTPTHTVNIPSEIQYSTSSFNFGNISRALNLVIDDSYNMSMQIASPSYSTSKTVVCVTWTNGLGDSFPYIDGGNDLGGMKIMAGGYWDYDDLDSNNEPKLKPLAEGVNGYAFRVSGDFSSYNVTYDVIHA